MLMTFNASITMETLFLNHYTILSFSLTPGFGKPDMYLVAKVSED